MKNKKDFHKKNVKELNIELFNLLHEQFNLKMRKANKQLQQYHLIRLVRRNIARVKTLLTKKLGDSNE